MIQPDDAHALYVAIIGDRSRIGRLHAVADLLLEGIELADMAGRKRELDASAAARIGSGRNLARFDTIILQPLIQFGQGVIVQNLVGYIVDAAMVSEADDDRSEERRVGKEGVRTCKFRW